MLPIEILRRDTPGTATVKHLNNAGAGLMPQPVLDVMLDHLRLESQIGGYEAAERRAAGIEQVYRNLGQLLSTGAHNIAIVENATVAFWQALAAFDFAPGDRIVTTLNDYASHYITFLALKQRRGIAVVTARELAEGGADPGDFETQLRHPRTRLATICWSPTNSGLIQDVATLVALCQAAEIPSVVDACQAVGQLPVNLDKLGCDFLLGTARKFLRGPRGIGFLAVSDKMLEGGKYPIQVDGRGATWQEVEQFTLSPAARRFENWEFPYALVLGLGSAAEYAVKVGVERGSERAFALAAQARGGLQSLPGVTILDRGAKVGAIVSAGVDGWDANLLVERLRERNINTSAADRAWALLDMDAKGASTALRVSPHYYNTEEEIDALVEALRELADRPPQREISAP